MKEDSAFFKKLIFRMAKEAGAIVTDLEGDEVTNKTRTFIAGNPAIHKNLLELVNAK